MRDKTTAILVLLTFLGMVGIYVGLFMAYQKYQAYSAQLQSGGGGVSGLLALLSNQGGA